MLRSTQPSFALIMRTSSTMRYAAVSQAVLFAMAVFVLLAAPLTVFPFPLWANLSITALLAGAIAVTLRRPAFLTGARFDLAYWQIILAGLALRILWLIAIPPVQQSDARWYWTIAETIARDQIYAVEIIPGAVARALYPPGYPAFLALWMIVTSAPQPVVIAVSNLALYVISTILLIKLTSTFNVGRAPVIVAVLLFACWPSLVTASGLALSEHLSITLLLLCLWLKTQIRPSLTWAVPLLGLVAGVHALVKAQFLLMPAVWLLYFLRIMPATRAIAGFTTLIVCMCIPIVPWTLRNHSVLGAPVLISTNGGDVFFRANNPLATGGWTPEAHINVAEIAKTEVEWNRISYQLGAQWIKANPDDFLKLTIKKAVRFFGSDDTGVYWSAERVLGQSLWTDALKHLSTLYWAALWAVIAFGILRLAGSWTPMHEAMVYTMALVAAVHCIYESQARYHMPVTPLAMIFAAVACAGPWKAKRPAFLSRSAADDRAASDSKLLQQP